MGRIKLKKEPDLSLKHNAFTYQREAFSALKELPYGAVFHEQGLGKTKIALDLAAFWLEQKVVDTVLFVVKKSLIKNWLDEIEMHTYLSPGVLTQSRRSNYYVFNSPARVLLSHFEVINSEFDRLELWLKTREVGIIIDESAKIKNPEALLTKSFLKLSPMFKKKIIMTGTPVANRPYDIWSQIYFLDGGKSLGNDYNKFKNDCDMSRDVAENDELQMVYEDMISNIYGKISNFCVRETKDSGVIELPEKVFETIYASWEPEQLEMYNQIKNEMRTVVLKDGNLKEDVSESVLKRLLRLVQVASYPGLVDDNYSKKPGKLGELIDLIRNIMYENEKAIIWTCFNDNVKWLKRELIEYGVCVVSGVMSIKDRNHNIDSFKKDIEKKILIATPGSAKEGLTLTVANHVIFFDRGFSLDDYLQAQDRIHRISQQKTCYVHNILMEDSVDEWVDALIYSKQLSAQLSQGDITIEHYRMQMTYSYANVLNNVLGIKEYLEE